MANDLCHYYRTIAADAEHESADAEHESAYAEQFNFANMSLQKITKSSTFEKRAKLPPVRQKQT